MRLKDKVCVVTGGASGLGKTFSLGLASEGAKVAVCAWPPAVPAPSTSKALIMIRSFHRSVH